MKITSATIGMESERRYQVSNRGIRRFGVTDYQKTYTQNNALLGTMVGSEKEKEQENQKAVEEEKVASLDEWKNRLEMRSSKTTIRRSESRIAEDLRQATIRYIFDLLFSARRNRMKEWLEEQGYTGGEGDAQQTGQLRSATTQVSFTYSKMQVSYGQMRSVKAQPAAGDALWKYESEETSFATMGKVRTADGREIDFQVQVGMSRAFAQRYEEEIKKANTKMCDPLVINLDTDVAELSDQKIFFDLDADGVEDEIAGLGKGSGYLALDRNGDGIINDGSELFGTKSGDGFADLSRYDEDGNGWIDENDAIWSKLKIWCKDENGNDVLYKLADKGVGAICLQKAATDFTQKTATGEVLGAIRSTGIFLYENGMAGTLQHVDVAKTIYQKQA